MNGFTDKQKEVMNQVQELLTEHFDAHVMIVTVYDINDEREHVTGGGFGGGTVAALGLIQHYDTKMKATLAKDLLEEDDE